MDLNTLFSEVIPIMIISWISVIFFIASIKQSIKRFRRFKLWIKILSDPNLNFEKRSWRGRIDGWVESFRQNFLAAPNNLRLAIQSAWRGRERGLAIFAGVFLASLVMTTVLGLSLIHISEPTRPY